MEFSGQICYNVNIEGYGGAIYEVRENSNRSRCF